MDQPKRNFPFDGYALLATGKIIHPTDHKSGISWITTTKLVGNDFLLESYALTRDQ